MAVVRNSFQIANKSICSTCTDFSVVSVFVQTAPALRRALNRKLLQTSATDTSSIFVKILGLAENLSLIQFDVTQAEDSLKESAVQITDISYSIDSATTAAVLETTPPPVTEEANICTECRQDTRLKCPSQCRVDCTNCVRSMAQFFDTPINTCPAGCKAHKFEIENTVIWFIFLFYIAGIHIMAMLVAFSTTGYPDISLGGTLSPYDNKFMKYETVPEIGFWKARP